MFFGALCKRKDDLLQNYPEDLVKCIESSEITTGNVKNQETSLPQSGDTH